MKKHLIIIQTIFILALLLNTYYTNAQQKAYIPDPNFRSFLIENYPTVMDVSDSLIVDAADTIQGLFNCGREGIYDVSGIEYFRHIEKLELESNHLTNLPDLSKNEKLTFLSCSNNELTYLPDLSANKMLEVLRCDNNKIASLPNLSSNVLLTYLECSYNQLTNLPNLSTDSALIFLNCSSNKLTSLPELTSNVNLVTLNCSGNQLTSLPDLTANILLSYLACELNLLTNLPSLTTNTKLSILNCTYNQLTSLPNLSTNTELTRIDCYQNQLTYLPDLSSNIKLTDLALFFNQLKKLPDLSANIALKSIDCVYNLITSLPDLSANTELQYVYCSHNKLDFSDARELRIADALPKNKLFITPQYPFGQGDTLDIEIGDTMRIHIMAQDSALSYQWFKDGVAIEGATDTFLIIPNVTLLDVGNYICKSYGSALLSPPLQWYNNISEFISEPFLLRLGNPKKAYIPDVNFRSFLNETYPELMDGTGDSLLINEAQLVSDFFDCSNKNIENLEGLQYFDNIGYLNCSENQLTSLPISSVNTNLKYINCSNNQLTSLPDLSSYIALYELDCYNNKLDSIPSLSANTLLNSLNCFGNNLTALPDLSSNTKLQFIDCNSNRLTKLPDLSRNRLVGLYISYNFLKDLPDLTNMHLLFFHCDGNKFDFSDTKEFWSIDTLWIEEWIYSPQNPFGTGDSIFICSGSPMVLSIAAQEYATNYQWFLNGNIINGANDTALIVANFTINDTGLYTCKSYGTALQEPYLLRPPGISEFVSAPFKVYLSGNSKKIFIPDPNFRSFLNETYSWVMDASGDSLIVDSAATFTGTFNCASRNIANITGIEYFTNTEAIHCSNNRLSRLPDFSQNNALNTFICTNNKFDFSEAKNLRIVNALPEMETFVYYPQNPFGNEDSIYLPIGETIDISIAWQDSTTGYQWFLNGNEIEGATDTLLRVAPLTNADYGTYTCKSYGTALLSPPMNFGPGIGEFVSAPIVVYYDLTGIESTNFDFEVNLFPNPTTRILNIQSAQFASYKLYDSSGRLVDKSTSNIIDFSRFEEGVYIVRLQDTSGNQCSKKVMYFKE